MLYTVTGDHSTIQQLPGLPTRVFAPSTRRQNEAFTPIVQQIRAAVLKLEPADVGNLKQFLKDSLYAHLPEEAQPGLADSPEELMKHVEQYWGPFNIDVIKLLANHLSVSDLKHSVTHYEEALCTQLKAVTWESTASVAAPPGYESVVIGMQKSQTISKVFEMKDFLGKLQDLKGSVILLAGLGDSGTSIVFHFPAGTGVAFLQRMCSDMWNREQLWQRGVQLIILPNMVSLDVEKSRLLYNSIDSVVDMQKVARKCPEFGILVIASGETESVKAFIKSLSGVDTAAVGVTTQTQILGIKTYRTVVSEVPVAIYIMPGVNEESGACDVTVILDRFKALNKDKKIHLTLFCFQLEEFSLKASHIATLKLYKGAGVDWTSTIIALMSAGPVKTQSATHQEVQKSPNMDVSTVFNEGVQMGKEEIRTRLVADVGLTSTEVAAVIITSVTADQLENLLYGEDWFIPLWLNILAFLPLAAYVRFLQMHHDKTSFIHTDGKDTYRFQKIAQSKFQILNVRLGSPIYAVGAPSVAHIVEGAAGAAGIVAVAVRPVETALITDSLAKFSGSNLTPIPVAVSESLPNPSMHVGFTEDECHALYQEAITRSPTITLHIVKAMTIGPPRVGKTALRHLLLELPLPEVSISTPVMKMAETVGILPPDEATSSAENEVSRPANADMELVHIGCEDEWVLVNEPSGILSLLSHLKEALDKATHCDEILKGAMVQLTSQEMKRNNSAQHAEMTQLEAQSCLAHADSCQTPTPSEPEQDKVKQPITGTSTGAAAEETTHVSAAVSQLHELLQAPGIANITLPDAKLLQFLDCGGQLAYHDILPIFTTIPAIYLHVFDLTQDLDAYPEDQICLDVDEGEVCLHARSPLSVADMMSQSMMTIASLADKMVQLPKDVLQSKFLEPHIVFVGTHLDEVAKKCKNMKHTLDGTSRALQSVLQSELHNVDEMVVKNQDQSLPARFFPVSCKHSVQPDVGRLAVKRLKGRIKKIVSDVKVKVPVKWYIYQMLELSHAREQHAPVHEYKDLFKSCHLAKVVDDVKEFHTMVTYFHALGLLIHACNEEACKHSEDSVCHIFTNPSYLFENISKLFHVHFIEEDRCKGSLRKLKLEGKLTEKTLKDLKVDNTQLDYEVFMDVLMNLFIGADIVDGTGKEGRTLFIPSVLPFKQTTQPVATEQSCHFVIAFSEKPFVPCGVYAGAIARLQSLKDWTIISTAGRISRSNASFGVAAEGTVHLFNCSSHIRVELSGCDGQKAQENRDNVLTAITESYCFLFHAKPTEGQPCANCWDDPYLELGLTCHCCENKANHIATLWLEDGEAKTVRCTRTLDTRRLGEEHLELFGCIQDNVYAVLHRQRTRTTPSRKVKMTVPVQSQEVHGECVHSQAVLHRQRTRTTSSSRKVKVTVPVQSQEVHGECVHSRAVLHRQRTRTTSSRKVKMTVPVLSQEVYERQDYLMLLRTYVSRKAAGKGRAVLEGVGLDAPTIEACFSAPPQKEEDAVQEGLISWCGGQGTQPPTWEVLLAAMDYAQIEQRYIKGLRKALGL